MAVVLFDDYLTRDLVLDAVEAELRYVRKVSVRHWDLRTAGALQELVRSEPGGVSFVTGVEDAMDEHGGALNQHRDALAERAATFWARADRYPDLSALAPDLLSYVGGRVERAALRGGLVAASALEPALQELERKHGMCTEEFLRRWRAGEALAVTPDDASRWAALARVLGRT
ncbi:MAG: hypothetical protein HY744_16630 [Deltaproteobacteria bacterium]|nr:hypothetical protein [Deltaproteobacteria bacterium]